MVKASKNKRKERIYSSRSLKKENNVISSVPGTMDILPRDESVWKDILVAGMDTARLFDFHYIETPIVEPLGVFSPAGLSQKQKGKSFSSDCFVAHGAGKIAVRAEYRNSILRSYAEHHLGYFSSPLRVFYYGQDVKFFHGKKKFSLSYDFGFEIIGETDPFYDAQILAAAVHLFSELKIKDISIRLNMGGCRTCRNQYREKLRSFLFSNKNSFCRRCASSVEDAPFSCLMCAEEKCFAARSAAPIALNYLCQNCNNHFRALLEFVEESGIVYESDPYVFIEREGYNKTVFQIKSSKNGSRELAIGGRYDYLMEVITGKQMPGVGITFRVFEIMNYLKERENAVKEKKNEQVFFIAVGEHAKKVSIRLMNMLRGEKIPVIEAIGKKALETQLKIAERMKSRVAIIVGQREVFEETVMIRDMKTGAQETTTLDKMVEEVKKRV